MKKIKNKIVSRDAELNFGEIIKSRLKAKGITAKQYADALGATGQTAYDTFNSIDVDTSKIKVACAMLKISIFDFFQHAYNYSQTGRVNSFGDENQIQYKPSNSPQSTSNFDNDKLLMQEKINSLTEQNRLLNKMIEMYEKQEKK